MKKQNAMARLRAIVEQDLPALEKNSILREGDTYVAFGKYRISPAGNKTYQVDKFTTDCGKFGSLKTAVSWCVADKFNQSRLANDIFSLDQHKMMLSADIETRTALANKLRDKDMKNAANIKIQSRRHRLEILEFRLAKCINLAKYWQIRGFNNETARTGRTASNRTNR